MTGSRGLRLVHIAKFFPPDPGGMEYFVQDLAREQAAKGHEVLVLAHAGAAKAGRSQIAPGLTLRRRGVWLRLGRGYAPLAPGLFWDTLTTLRHFKPDLIHLHCPNLAGTAFLAQPLPAPLILHWHADVVFPPVHSPAGWQLALWRKLERSLIRRAARVITTSPRYALTSNVLPDYVDKVRVAPLGLPAVPNGNPGPVTGPAASWLRGRPAGRRLLAIGRLSHYKGFSILLEALAGLPEAFLCLIGQGEEMERLEAQCARLGLGERVLIAGQVSDGERDVCLELADLFCLPSLDRSEAFGLVLLEAMRAGMACLSTSVSGSGMSYALDEGRAGILVEPGSVAQLRAAIAEALADVHQRQRLAEIGRKRFLAHFTIPVVAARIEEVYLEAMKLWPHKLTAEK